MAVRIRLKRMGRKKAPHYRVVVADSKSPRDGRFVETLGYFKPLSDPARLVLDLERVDYWVGQGASPSGTVKSLISKARAGGDASLAVGEEDLEAKRKAEQEALAARRAAEKAKAEEEAKAAEEAEKAAKAEAEAAAKAEAEAEEAPAAEAEEAPEAEAEEAPAAEAEEAAGDEAADAEEEKTE
jgi:small subunit ribosomal protein S16